MKAIYLKTPTGAASLTYGELPQPQVSDDDILIRVHAAAITPQELAWPSTFRTSAGEPRPFPVVLGHQFSGVVESIGAKVATVKAGDPVFGITDWHGNGAQAEYCVASAATVAVKPRLIDHVQASVLPIPALAAWLGLFDLSRLQSDQHILINGATRSVGIIAVQLARWRGARITATAPAGDRSLLQLLGADTVIDERTTGRESEVNDVDVVLDCVGSEALERSYASLIAGGRFATMASSCSFAKGTCVWDSLMRIRSMAAHFAQIGKLVDAGDIRVFIDSVYPLSRTKRAYARSARGRYIGEMSVRIVE
jgi:NADPH:quinone reductase-like Zn-dependent oxidoreductase